ncbi:uncharacterized protein LOC128224049 [Mya arenaria]|uniref:uncharacterized protein LOC128223740 n=1 Tax=Mya arenaria TaxID=6604 RepID=UPI0022E54333|nr:uncharacterized protein LOC128223740 [Mya arenaria]XP_052789640.1 uncharacterized protein LOC128224049 [Mya arenaria]
MFSVDCYGTETDISQCQWTKENNDREYQTLHLSCSDYEIKNVRIIGQSDDVGLVEVFVNSNWRTVCEAGFTNYSANLICQELGFSNAKWYTTMDQSNSDTKVVSLICDQADILIRDCEIIPLAYYTYGSGGCSGNGVSIACSKDQPTSTVSTVTQTTNEVLDMYLVVILMSVIVGLVLCLLVGGLFYCKLTGKLCFSQRHQKPIEESAQPSSQNKTQSGGRSPVSVVNKRGECKGDDEEYTTIDDSDDLGLNPQNEYYQLRNTNDGKIHTNDSRTNTSDDYLQPVMGKITSDADVQLDDDGYLEPVPKVQADGYILGKFTG